MITTNPKTPEQLQAWADKLAAKLLPQEAGYLAAALAMKQAEKAVKK